MKIETTHTAQPALPATKVEAKQVRPTDTENNKAAEITGTHQMRSRMLQWFARAGITPASGLVSDKDIGKRISRHQYMKAQRKLKNLEAILNLALDYSLDQGSTDDVDADWFFNFVDLAEDIHSPAMQELWGKIFSVEVGHPGTFSLRTLEVLKRLTQRDAQIFKIAVSLSSRKKGENTPRIVFGYNQKPSMLSLFRLPTNHHLNLAVYGLAYPSLLSLMDMGLIYNTEIESGELNLSARHQYRCAGQTFHIAPKSR